MPEKEKEKDEKKERKEKRKGVGLERDVLVAAHMAQGSQVEYMVHCQRYC